MKQCKKCKLVLSEHCFYRHSQMKDGRLNACKDCVKSRVNKSRKDNAEHYRKYDRRRYKDGGSRGEATPEAKARAKRAWAKRNPEKRSAHIAVNNAIRDGRLTRKTCEVCGGKAQAHHDDYSKPLDVRWLCSRHHAIHHHGSDTRVAGKESRTT